MGNFDPNSCTKRRASKAVGAFFVLGLGYFFK